MATDNRRYEGVPEGTLLCCLQTWEQLLYWFEYNLNENVAMTDDVREEYNLLRLDVALDVSDILAELDDRGKRLTWLEYDNAYTTNDDDRTKANRRSKKS